MSNTGPTRVLHVVSQMNRNGLESRIMDIYRNIDRSKIQFDFLTHRLTPGQFDEEIKSLGGNLYYLPAIRPQKIISYRRTLDKFFSEHDYKIVHAHLNSYCTWVLSAAKKAGVPVRIAHSRNSGMDHNWKAIFKYLSKQFVNKPTTHKFACSRQAGEWLFGKKGIEHPNYFKVIPNGFEISKFSYSEDKRKQFRQILGLTDELTIVHVGRITYQKNHAFLVKVFKELIGVHPNSKLFLLGDGDLRKTVEQQCIDLGIQNKVVFMGNIQNVGDYLNAMDIMVFPSIYEGFGTVVIETQCNGLPTIASDVLPKETQITDCLEFMSISKQNELEWAQEIVRLKDIVVRKDRTEEIKEAGYDIHDTYRILSEFYLEMTEKNS
jgi:Glycosyltransferase